jgi:hypothetical protein
MRFNKIAFIKVLKSDKTLLAFMVAGLVLIAILGFTMPSPTETVKTVSNQPISGTVAGASASKTSDTGSVDDTVTASTTTSTTPAKSSVSNGQILTAASTTTPSASTTPTTPQNPQSPPTGPDPEASCKINGRVAVLRGGVSCSYSIGTVDGSSIQWYLPALYSYTDGTGAIEKPLAPVYVVIESKSTAPSGQPFTAVSITYHYASLASAPLGDYVDGSDGLAFSEIGPGGMPLWLPSPDQLTILAPVN